jgi:hypothetical protein
MISVPSNPGFHSYLKSTLACAVLVAAALLCAGLAGYRLPGVLGPVVTALCALAALCAAVLTCAGVLVMARHRRGARGVRDLFLELNRSREPAAIRDGAASGAAPARRWLAWRLLGHDFVVGDLVEVKSWKEIRATLDEHGCLEQMPFMPEMLAMCGRRAHVFRCMHRLFDYRKTRRMRHMDGAVLLVGAVCDGSNHGGCEAACHTVWKTAWLRRVEPGDRAGRATASATGPDPLRGVAVLQHGVQPPRYVCQLTELNAASRPVRKPGLANFLLPVVSGNVTLSAFAVGWLTYLFNDLQHYRGGVTYPAFDPPPRVSALVDETPLKAGDQVLVRSSAAIRATLNDRLIHRGLGFEPDMLKHCGHRYAVEAEVRKLVDVVTGEMRTMKTQAYMLRDVHFSGERQLFNAQYEPLFWRGVWLQRIETEGDARG